MSKNITVVWSVTPYSLVEQSRREVSNVFRFVIHFFCITRVLVKKSLERPQTAFWILRSLLPCIFLFLLDGTDINLCVVRKFQKTVKGINLPEFCTAVW